MNSLKLAAILCSLALSPLSLADWKLDTDQSRLSFISTKASHKAEVHQFTDLTGTISESGAASIRIALTSVETGIDIRNSRMQSMLFESEQFPFATLSATIDAGSISRLPLGESVAQPLTASLDLHGQQVTVETEVMVIKLADQRLLVTSVKPLILDASAFSLVEGIEKLREVAGLPVISHAVPVSFLLTFTQS